MLEKQRIEYLKRKLANHAQEYVICTEAGLIEEAIKEDEACDLIEVKLKNLGVDYTDEIISEAVKKVQG